MTLIPAGRLAVDDSFTFPNVGQLVEAGVAAEVRYASRPDSNPKNWTAAQIAERHDAGIGVVMIHEQTATDSLGGASAGTRDADIFARYADVIGYPRTAPALCACDTSPQPVMVEYAAAFQDRIRALGWSLTGVYGGVDLIGWCAEAGVCSDVLWQAYGWSALSGTSSADALRRVEARWPGRDYELLPSNERNAYAIDKRAHVFQRFGRQDIPTNVVTTSIDENIIRRPLPVWLPGETNSFPPPTSTEDAMLRLVRFTGNGAVFLAPQYQNGLIDTVRWISPALYDAYLPHTGDVVDIDAAAIPNVTCIGPVPPGNWPFFRVVDGGTSLPGLSGPPGPPGLPGPQGPPGPTPKSVTFSY